MGPSLGLVHTPPYTHHSSHFFTNVTTWYFVCFPRAHVLLCASTQSGESPTPSDTLCAWLRRSFSGAGDPLEWMLWLLMLSSSQDSLSQHCQFLFHADNEQTRWQAAHLTTSLMTCRCARVLHSVLKLPCSPGWLEGRLH